jgi:hypothetical protein
MRSAKHERFWVRLAACEIEAFDPMERAIAAAARDHAREAQHCAA